MTRGTAARLLVAGPAALAFPKLLEAASAPLRRSALSVSERRQFDKSVAQLRSAAAKIRKLAIPMGAEPSFAFQPLLPKK